MGVVVLDNGIEITMDEVDSRIPLLQLYTEALCEQYTDTFRCRLIRACGKLERRGWGILPHLRDLEKSDNKELAAAAKEAVRRIDPGAPLLAPVTGSSHPERSSSAAIHTVETQPKTFPIRTDNGATIYRKLEVRKVSIHDIGNELTNGTIASGHCSFCGKMTLFTDIMRQYIDNIAGHDKNGHRRLLCNFCLRNEFYRIKHVRNTLIMTFRGLIGYYYFCFYYGNKQGMTLSEIEAYIQAHVRVGVQNPLFRYDADSFLWFVDFNKVGNRKHQMPLKYVLDTIVEILASFQMYESVRDSSPASFFQKYKEAVVDFHHHRRRPEGQKILVPTLYGCNIPHEMGLKSAIPVAWLKDFTPLNMVDNITANKKKMAY